MDVRRYHYDADDVQHLFAKIIKSLSSPEVARDAISQILVEVCQHFKFGCGFVYEADHTLTFNLKERFSAYDASGLPESLKLEQRCSVEEIGSLLNLSDHFQDLDGEGIKHDASNRIFESNTVMLAPIAGDDNKVIGLVGMIDRRRNILMNEQAIHAAKMVLNLLGNSIKLRILQKRLRYALQSLSSILDNAGIDIYVNDFNTHEILYVNKSMAESYGGHENMLGKTCWQALYSGKNEQCEYCPKDKIVDEEGNPTKVFSWDYQRPFDGSWFRVLSAAFFWIDGRLAHVVSSVNITDRKKNEATIARMANYDALTNLPNRRKMRLDYEEAAGSADGNTAYLLFLDLDNFKILNDSVGHQAGDELLIQIGATLMQNPLTGKHIYRHGGDEFALVYHNAGRGHVHRVIDFLLERFEQPWPLKNASPVCPASIGVAFCPDDGRTLDDLLHNADLMMYKAKQNGGGIACFADGEIVRPKK